MWKPPGWKGPRLINGVPQYGRANPNSTMPYYGAQIKGLMPRFSSTPVGLAALRGQQSSPQQRENPIAGILADYMNQARADFGAQSSAEKGDMINNIRKYMISYGAAPDMEGLSKDAQGYLKQALDPKTLQLMQTAEKEGLSSRARLGQANEKATRLIPASLAARGILRSGQTGSDLGDQAMQYKQSGYDMLNEMLGAITGSVSGYQNAERERQRQLAEMEMQMAMQAAGDWGDSDTGPQPPGAPPPSNVGVSSNPRNNPLYSYMRNGRRIRSYTLRPASGTRGGGV